MTTTIVAMFRGEPEDLQDANVTAVHYASRRRLVGNQLTVWYVCETDNYEAALTSVMDSIDIGQVENCGCDLLSIG